MKSFEPDFKIVFTPPSARAAKLRGVVIGEHLKFLYRVEGWLRHKTADRVIVVIDAIDVRALVSRAASPKE